MHIGFFVAMMGWLSSSLSEIIHAHTYSLVYDSHIRTIPFLLAAFELRKLVRILRMYRVHGMITCVSQLLTQD